MTVDDLAQWIRIVDGDSKLGAGALAEALFPYIPQWTPIEEHDGSREPVLLIGRYPDQKTWSDIYHGWWTAPYRVGDAEEPGYWNRWPHHAAPTHFMKPVMPS